MTHLNLKCPNCGHEGEIEVNTNPEEQTYFQCPWCGQQGNQKLFEVKEEGIKSDEMKSNDFWT